MRLSTNLAFIAGCLGQVIAWKHVGERELKDALQTSHRTLVAFIYGTQRASETLETQWDVVQKTATDVRMASFDCAAAPTVCHEYGVSSFPAIRLYQYQGVRFERYRGPRRASAIRSFLKRAARPVVSTVTEKNLTDFTAVDEIVFVARLGSDDAALRQRFGTLAQRYRDRFSFAMMPTTGSSYVSCHNRVRGFEKKLKDLSKVGSLKAFVKECSVPLIPELTRRNEMEFTSKDKSFVHYFASDADEREAYVAQMLPLAKKYEEYLLFTTIDVEEYPKMLGVYGQPPESEGVLSVYHPGNGQLFPLRKTWKGLVSAEVVERFLLDIIAGKIRPWDGRMEELAHEEL